MALHEQALGATDEWYTPAYVFEAMATRFDLDPCPAVFQPGKPALPAEQWCNHSNWLADGLESPWYGDVWMNPPFGGRNGLIPWLERFRAHGQGVALVPDRTSTPWWQTYIAKSGPVMFVSPKIRFISPEGLPGRSPAQGTCLLGLGCIGETALSNAARNGLGALMRPAQ